MRNGHSLSVHLLSSHPLLNPVKLAGHSIANPWPPIRISKEKAFGMPCHPSSSDFKRLISQTDHPGKPFTFRFTVGEDATLSSQIHGSRLDPQARLRSAAGLSRHDEGIAKVRMTSHAQNRFKLLLGDHNLAAISSRNFQVLYRVSIDIPCLAAQYSDRFTARR